MFSLALLASEPTASPDPITNSVTLSIAAPPLPTIVAPTAPEKRGKLEVWWKPSTATNVSGYLVYYGTNQGIYPMFVNVGNVTNVTIKNLDEGRKYWVTARAYNASLVTGPASNEGSATTGVFISMAMDRWRIESYGLSGRTNRMQVSTNLTNWRTILTWVGNGRLTNTVYTNVGVATFRVMAN